MDGFNSAPSRSDLHTVQQLLEEQLHAMQRAMAINKEVVARLHGSPPAITTRSFEPPAPAALAELEQPDWNHVDSGGACCMRREQAPGRRNNSFLQRVLPFGSGDREAVARTRGLGAPLLAELDDTPKQRRRDKSPPRTRSIFPEKNDLKVRLQGYLRSQTSNDIKVDDGFSDSGFFPQVARSNTFKNLTFLVIFLNTVWIAIDTDYNDADMIVDALWEFQVVENAFCFYFTMELFIRFMAYRRMSIALSDAWFLFDSFLVLCMIWETWISVIFYIFLGYEEHGGSAATVLRVFRLFRLTRVARIGRLVANVPELLILAKGMYTAVRSVFSTLALMLIVIYIFAVLFTQTLRNTDIGKGKFERVPQAMNYLLLTGVFPDQGDDLNDMLDAHWTYYVFMALYLLVGSLTIMNMLIGVICEVVARVAEAESAGIAEEQMKEKIRSLLPAIDKNNDGFVSRQEFVYLMQDHGAMEKICKTGVDILELLEYSDTLWQDDEDLSFEDFVEKILKFRDQGTTQQTITSQLKNFEERLVTYLGRLPGVEDAKGGF